jgi:hypothetical protein
MFPVLSLFSEISQQISKIIQLLFDTQNLLSKHENENQLFNLSSFSKLFNNSILSNLKKINQYSEIISKFMNIFYHNDEQFSINQISKIISTLQK